MKNLICCCLLTLVTFQNLLQAQSPVPDRLAAGNVTPSVPYLPRTMEAQVPLTPGQHFVCDTGFTPRQCDEQLLVLRRALSNYPLAPMGDWTWILVRSQDWKAILLPRGLDPDSPAFTILPRRQTFIEEALLSPIPVRARELLLKWNMTTPDLLDLAIRHELGHAFCDDLDERNADRTARLLEQKKAVSCVGSRRRNE